MFYQNLPLPQQAKIELEVLDYRESYLIEPTITVDKILEDGTAIITFTNDESGILPITFSVAKEGR